MSRRKKYDGWNAAANEPNPHIMLDQWQGEWRGTEPVDMTGRPIEPGSWLVKTYQSGRSSNLEIRQVREIRRTGTDPAKPLRVFMDDSRVPLEYPGRCLVVDWDPQAEKLRGF